jgi:hypothetical protein
MADFDETYPVTDELKEHWHIIRAQRGWSWDVLADYFERYCQTDPTTPGLIEWARSQGKADASRTRQEGRHRARHHQGAREPVTHGRPHPHRRQVAAQDHRR